MVERFILSWIIVKGFVSMYGTPYYWKKHQDPGGI